ncbi:MAG: hypothetical protein IPJ19_19345 [Planctomycetes bacterium]|nr:hypothetical protein [Planctomycetota bacterium]
MNLRVHWLVVLLALALAWPLRTRAGAGNVVEPGELYGVSALFSDGESYAHARRIACALEGAGIGSRDGMLGHPDPAELVGPPLYDAARAALAQTRVAQGDELGLQRFLAGIGPWAGALACFLVWLAASAAGAGALESLLAAAWVAVAPACVQGAEFGRLGDVAFGLVPLALAARFASRTLSSAEPLRAVLGGISSGALAGLLLANSPAGLVPFLAGAAAFAYWTFRSGSELARFAARAGLFYALVGALVARMLVLDGPWQADPGGLFAAWVELASVLAFACAAPFLVAMAREQFASKRFLPFLVMLAGAVMIVVLLARAREPMARVWDAWMQARALRPLFGTHSALSVFVSLTPLVLLVPLGWFACLRAKPGAASLYLVLLSAGTLVATLLDPELASWCVLAGALVLARAVTGWGKGARERRWAIGIGAAVLAVHALAGFLVLPDMSLHETRVEIARGLRWMRDHTPSPGPWNAPRAQPDWGVVSVPARGAQLAWDARRPAVFSEAGEYGKLESLRAAESVLQARNAADLTRAMHGCGARYLVLSPLEGDVDPAPDSGLVRRYASTRLVDRAGHALAGPGLPAISIWELPPPEKSEDSGPQMTPR